MSDFPRIGHVALTVKDLNHSVPWYEKLFGSKLLMEGDEGAFRHCVWMIGDNTIISLHEFPDLVDDHPFNERRIGLDHLAFACANRAELEQWEKRLDELGVRHGGIVDAAYGSGLSFRDPDNNALEFFALPG
jgi:catechol-2,3-dioxygenase